MRHLKLPAFVAVGSLLVATTGEVIAAEPTDPSGSLARIMQARSSNFSELKGKSRPDDVRGNHVWDGKERPFSLFCTVNEGNATASGYSYRCGHVRSSLEGPSPILSSEDAGQLYADIKAAFATAAPDLAWHDLKTEWEGNFVAAGRSPNEDVLAVTHITSFDTNVVAFKVSAATLDHPF